MNPTPYLTFQGNCREALTFYAEVFGAKIEMMMRAGDARDYPVPPEQADWIMHGAVEFDGGLLMASDDIMGGTPPMAGCSISMALPTTEHGREVFEALSEGGEVRMPYQPTFWSPGFGTLRDRFGTNWMITTSEPLPA